MKLNSLILALGAFATGAFAQNAHFNFGDGGVPMFTHLPAVIDAKTAATTPLATWSSSFVYNGTTYPYTMVGANPSTNVATAVNTIVVPLKFVFSDGTVLDPTVSACGQTRSALDLTLTSPVFVSSTFSPGGTNVGTTQYVDAYQRANFWSKVSTVSPNYHVTLPTTVVSTVTINVPRLFGKTVAGPCAKIGEVAINWFDNYLRNQVIPGIAAINPGVLPLFVNYNTFWTQAGGCCILGYHSATGPSSSLQTYATAAFSDPGIFSVPIQDVHALSHEIGEWMDDPYVNNTVPGWTGGQVSGCSTVLENGDPVTGTAFTVTLGGFTYHPEDLVFLPWFSRESPSSSVNGWYTFLNTYTTPAAVCN